MTKYVCQLNHEAWNAARDEKQTASGKQMCGILLMTRDAQRLEERASLMLHEDVARYVLSNSHHDDVEKLSGHESGISA
jgi:hypothetical protein